MKIKVTEVVVNKDLLDNAIDSFDTIHKNKIAYLITNTETAKVLNEQLCEKYFSKVIGDKLGMYRGSKILIDESLEFGEVDVR